MKEMNGLYLRQLSPADGRDIYELLQAIPAEENGMHNNAMGLPYEEYQDWLLRCDGHSRGEGLPDWMVPETAYWLYLDGIPIGIARIRHRLNENLEVNSGHIGYAIAPAYRGRGYGNEFLCLILAECVKLGIEIVQIGANRDNLPSNRMILHNGFILYKQTEKKVLYRKTL